MLTSKLLAFGFAAVVAALSYETWLKPVLRPVFHSLLPMAPVDTTYEKIPLLSIDELYSVFNRKRILIVGGSRGVGRGMAAALTAAGADITVVGRSRSSGDKIMRELKHLSVAAEQTFRYIQGDLSSVAAAQELVRKLQRTVQEHGRFDCLVQTAAVFPDWSKPPLQEDGLDVPFAVAVVGRFLIYSAYRDLLHRSDTAAAILNVMAGGQLPLKPFDRSFIAGQKNISCLATSLSFISLGNDLMMLALRDQGKVDVPMVSTHPGLLKTDLHRGQGLLFDIAEWVGVSLFGISEEEAGYRQACILAATLTGLRQRRVIGAANSNPPVAGRGLAHRSPSLQFVDPEMRVLTLSAELQEEADRHMLWMWNVVLLSFASKEIID